MENSVINIFNNITNFQALSILIGLFMAFVIAIYTVYSFLMVRQVKLLNRSFNTEGSYVMRYFALGHLLATLLLLLFTIVSIF